MIIKWFGQSTFEIKSGAGLVTDPYGRRLGDLPSDLSAAVVTVSHDHWDHNFVEAILGQPRIINQLGDFAVDGFQIKGIASFHDNESGSKRGSNIIYAIKAENISICHLGDLGHILTDGQIKQIGPVDILMIPVGGTYTIDANMAAQVVGQISPKLVLPMHYKRSNSSVDLPIDTAEGFVKMLGWATKQVNQLEIDRSSLDLSDRQIILFNA